MNNSWYSQVCILSNVCSLMYTSADCIEIMDCIKVQTSGIINWPQTLVWVYQITIFQVCAYKIYAVLKKHV